MHKRPCSLEVAGSQNILDIHTVSYRYELPMSMATLASGSHGVHISFFSWKHFPNHLNFSLGEDPESHPVYQSNFPRCYMPSKKQLPVSCIHRLLSLFQAK